MSTISICPCDQHNIRECDNTLYLNERLSDLTITFPSHNISFPAHRFLMAKKSLYFENLFYGPMAMNEKEWKVRDNDIEPEVFKIMLAHMYDLNLLEENIEITLQIYKLADFYMIDSLRSQCLRYLRNIMSKDSNGTKWDYQYILEWAREFEFNDIKNEVFECLSTKINFDGCDHSFLMNFTLETCKEFLSVCQSIDRLSFTESWINPTNPLSSEVVISLVEGALHKAKGELMTLQGCFSPQVFNKIGTIEEWFAITNLSLIDNLHSRALYECVTDLNLYKVNLHIRCNSISPYDLVIWSSNINALYLSNVDDDSVHWAAATSISLNPEFLYLPKCSLSIKGFKALIAFFIPMKIDNITISIYSPYITSEKYLDELKVWLRENETQIQIQDINICDWNEGNYCWWD